MKYIYLFSLLLSQYCFAQSNAVNVADLTVTIPGSMAAKPEDLPTYYYAFNKGDMIVLNFSTENAKGTQNVTIEEYPFGSQVYSNQEFKTLTDIQIPVTRKAIYKFTFSTNFIFDRTCKVSLKRIPLNEDSKFFNCNVKWATKPDTIWETVKERTITKQEIRHEQILDKNFVVHSQTNSNGNRSYISFQLPPHTSYWVYWIGVGQESIEQFHNLEKEVIRKVGEASGDPLVAFGMNLITDLPQLNSSGNIDYWFMNRENVTPFMQNKQYATFGFATGQGIIRDYMRIDAKQTPRTDDGYLYICFQNSNVMTGLDVTLKIVSFTLDEQYDEHIVRKPQNISMKKVALFDE